MERKVIVIDNEIKLKNSSGEIINPKNGTCEYNLLEDLKLINKVIKNPEKTASLVGCYDMIMIDNLSIEEIRGISKLRIREIEKRKYVN